MASSNAGINPTVPAIPFFKGSEYEVWSTKMKTLFMSQDLWELVEKGYVEEGVSTESLKDVRKRDAKALFFIQQAVDDSIFPRISATTRSKEAWDALKNGYQGTAKVVTVKLQTLRRKFDSSFMKDTESMDEYFNNLMEVVNKMRKYGEEISYQKVVEKILRSLPRKYEAAVAAIEESKDLTVLTVDELLGSLQSHEDRQRGYEESSVEKAFHTKLHLSKDN